MSIHNSSSGKQSTKMLEKEPEKAERVAELVYDLMDPSNGESYKALGRKHHFCDKTVKKLHERMMANYQPITRELKDIRTEELVAKIENRLDLALDYLTGAKMDRSTAKDLAIVIGVLAEKRQLLSGEATSIISVEDSRQLNEILPAVLAEAKRRGLDLNRSVIEGEFSSSVTVGMRKGPKNYGEDKLRRSKQGQARSPLR